MKPLRRLLGVRTDKQGEALVEEVVRYLTSETWNAAWYRDNGYPHIAEWLERREQTS